MSKLLDAMHDTAIDLNAAGVMDVQTLREFDTLCLTEVERFDPHILSRSEKKDV